MSKGILNMSKLMKRLTAVACSVAMAVTTAMICFPTTSLALGEEWECRGDGWYYLPGTDVRVKVEEDVITFEGNGAIPDYNHDYMSKRPWHGSKAQYIFVGEGITSIGTYAFAKLKDLQWVQMYSTTFLADATCFYHDTNETTVIRVMGSAEATRLYNTIPYTSLDSIAAVAQSGYAGCTYVFDSNSCADKFRNKTNPTIGNVFSADFKVEKDKDGKKKDSPWFNPGDYTGDITYTPICKLSPNTPNSSLDVVGQKRIQGTACYEAFGLFIGNYQYGDMYRLQVMKNNKIVETTENPYTYVWNIPAELQCTGRTFKMLAIGRGNVITYDDEDASDATFTMTTSSPSTAYCLVYM